MYDAKESEMPGWGNTNWNANAWHYKDQKHEDKDTSLWHSKSGGWSNNYPLGTVKEDEHEQAWHNQYENQGWPDNHESSVFQNVSNDSGGQSTWSLSDLKLQEWAPSPKRAYRNNYPWTLRYDLPHKNSY